MNTLDQIINRLKSDKMLCFDIQDVANNRLLDNNKSAEEILQSFGDLKTYFKSFHSDRVKQIGILVKRRNGNRYGTKEEPVIINFKPAEQVHTDLSLGNEAVAPTHQPNNNGTVNFQGLGGGAKALELDEFMDLKYDKKDFEKLKLEHSTLKGKYTKERKKRKKYEAILIEKSTTPFLETETGKQLLGFGKEVFPMIVEKFTPNGAGALAGAKQQPSELDGMSASKIEFVKSILKDARLDDAGVNDLTAIAVGVVNIPEFKEALDTLMYEYELKTLE